MSLGTALVVIVAIVAFTVLKLARHYSRQDRLDRRTGDDNGRLFGIRQEDPEDRREIEDLRERIKVLERIATDGNSIDARETQRISREIEALRDRQESSS